MGNTAKVPRPKGPNDTQVSVNLPGNWMDEVEKLVHELARPGEVLTRSDVVRMALRAGLDVLSKAKKR